MAQAAKPPVANSTFGAPVYRGDGLRLYGLDAELEMKAQEKRDPELETALEKWIEEVICECLEPKGNLQKSLKSGVALCKMMNKLWPNSIKTINMKPIGMMEMENIGFYLKCCWNLGIPSAELFVTSDLYNNKHFQAVLDNLLSVARVAHAQEDYSGPVLPAVAVPSSEAKKKKAKKHREVNPQPAGLWNEQAPETPETALRRQLEEQAEAHVRLQQELERVQGLLVKEKYKREELQAQLSKAVSRDARKSRLLQDAAKALEPSLSVAAADAQVAEVKAKLAAELEAERKEKSQLQVELQRMQERAYRKSIQLRSTQSEQEQLKEQLKREEENAQTRRRTEVGNLEAELAKIRAQLAEAKEKRVRAETSEEQLRSQVRMLQEENATVTERTHKLEEESLSLERERMQREAEAAEAGREVLKLREELSNALSGQQSAESQAQGQLASKNAELDELSSRVTALKTQLEEASVRLAASKKEIASLSADLESARAELKRREAASAAATAQVAELTRQLASSSAEIAGLREEIQVLRRGESNEAAEAAVSRAAAAEMERKAQALASELAALKQELQRETEAAALRVQEVEEAASEDKARQAEELERTRELLNQSKLNEEERAQQVDDFKRQATERIKDLEKELEAAKTQVTESHEAQRRQQSTLAAELAQLRVQHTKEAQEAGRMKIQLSRQVADEARARAVLATELQAAHVKIVALQQAATAAAASKTVSIAASPPPVVASGGSSPAASPSGSTISSVSVTGTSTSPVTPAARSADGKDLKRVKSERKMRSDSATKAPGDAVAALGRSALTQSAVLERSQPKPELQRVRTELLRTEAAKRAGEAAKESDAVDKLRKRDERRLREGVPAILKGEEVDLHSIKRLYSICSSDVGRRAFIKVLKTTMKETKNLVLPSQSFEVLVYLYNYSIQAMQATNNVDFRACMIFMYTSQALCRKTPSGETEYLAQHIRAYEIWHSVVFWEEYFWAELRKKYDEQNKELGDTVDSETFANLFCPLILSSFVHDMIISWDVPPAVATEFITDMVAANALSKKHYDTLMSELRDYVAARQDSALKKQAGENLRRRHRATQQLSGGGGGGAGAGARRGPPGLHDDWNGEDEGLMIGTAAKWNRVSRAVQASRPT